MKRGVAAVGVVAAGLLLSACGGGYTEADLASCNTTKFAWVGSPYESLRKQWLDAHAGGVEKANLGVEITGLLAEIINEVRSAAETASSDILRDQLNAFTDWLAKMFDYYTFGGVLPGAAPTQWGPTCVTVSTDVGGGPVTGDN